MPPNGASCARNRAGAAIIVIDKLTPSRRPIMNHDAALQVV